MVGRISASYGYRNAFLTPCVRGARYALCRLLFLWTLKTDTVLMERIEEELKCKGGQRIVRNPALR